MNEWYYFKMLWPLSLILVQISEISFITTWYISNTNTIIGSGAGCCKQVQLMALNLKFKHQSKEHLWLWVSESDSSELHAVPLPFDIRHESCIHYYMCVSCTAHVARGTRSKRLFELDQLWHLTLMMVFSTPRSGIIVVIHSNWKACFPLALISLHWLTGSETPTNKAPDGKIYFKNLLTLGLHHLLPNTARTGSTTEGALFISIHLSTHAVTSVSALSKAWVLIK